LSAGAHGFSPVGTEKDFAMETFFDLIKIGVFPVYKLRVTAQLRVIISLLHRTKYSGQILLVHGIYYIP
jgi:hypothetical protein